MNPLDFFNTAELLSKYTKPEHLRTSVGRSYYAVFLLLRNFLAENGLKKKRSAHEFVRKCFQYCEVKEGTELANSLYKLHQRRSDADYFLEKQITPNICVDALDRAKKITKDFAELAPNKKQEILIGAKKHVKAAM